MNYLNQSESAKRRNERNRLLTEMYCQIYDNLKKQKVSNPRRIALAIALSTGTPCYHVGFDRAYIVVPQLLANTSSMSFKNHENHEMWLDIAQKVKCLTEQGKMSIAKALDIVLEQCRASRFFLSENHAWVIIKQQLKKMNCRKPYGRTA